MEIINPREKYEEKVANLKRKPVIIGWVKDIIPIILCKEREDINLRGAMKFYCPYCRKNHCHGTGEGHRIAHCHNEKSLFERHGYIITLNPNFVLSEKSV